MGLPPMAHYQIVQKILRFCLLFLWIFYRACESFVLG